MPEFLPHESDDEIGAGEPDPFPGDRPDEDDGADLLDETEPDPLGSSEADEPEQFEPVPVEPEDQDADAADLEAAREPEAEPADEPGPAEAEPDPAPSEAVQEAPPPPPAVEPDPEPASNREYDRLMSRMEAASERLEQIEAQEKIVESATSNEKNAQAIYKSARENRISAETTLFSLIRNRPEYPLIEDVPSRVTSAGPRPVPNFPLPAPSQSAPASPAPPAPPFDPAVKAPKKPKAPRKPKSGTSEPLDPAADTSYRDVALSDLDIPKRQLTALAKAEPEPFLTIGDIERFTSDEKNTLDKIKGITMAGAQFITDGLDKFWADRKSKMDKAQTARGGSSVDDPEGERAGGDE